MSKKINKEAERLLRLRLEIEREHRRQMREKCKAYVSQPIFEMDDAAARHFVNTMAETTYKVMRVRDGGEPRRLCLSELEQYAAALKGSIDYFNHRSEAHARHMEYLEKCQTACEAQREREAERRRNKGKDIIIHII